MLEQEMDDYILKNGEVATRFDYENVKKIETKNGSVYSISYFKSKEEEFIAYLDSVYNSSTHEIVVYDLKRSIEINRISIDTKTTNICFVKNDPTFIFINRGVLFAHSVKGSTRELFSNMELVRDEKNTIRNFSLSTDREVLAFNTQSSLKILDLNRGSLIGEFKNPHHGHLNEPPVISGDNQLVVNILESFEGVSIILNDIHSGEVTYYNNPVRLSNDNFGELSPGVAVFSESSDYLYYACPNALYKIDIHKKIDKQPFAHNRISASDVYCVKNISDKILIGSRDVLMVQLFDDRRDQILIGGSTHAKDMHNYGYYTSPLNYYYQFCNHDPYNMCMDGNEDTICTGAYSRTEKHEINIFVNRNTNN